MCSRHHTRSIRIDIWRIDCSNVVSMVCWCNRGIHLWTLTFQCESFGIHTCKSVPLHHSGEVCFSCFVMFKLKDMLNTWTQFFDIFIISVQIGNGIYDTFIRNPKKRMGNVVLACEGWINFKTKKKNWENFSEKYSQTGYCFLCFSNVFFRATSELKRDWKKSNVYFLVVW